MADFASLKSLLDKKHISYSGYFNYSKQQTEYLSVHLNGWTNWSDSCRVYITDDGDSYELILYNGMKISGIGYYVRWDTNNCSNRYIYDSAELLVQDMFMHLINTTENLKEEKIMDVRIAAEEFKIDFIKKCPGSRPWMSNMSLERACITIPVLGDKIMVMIERRSKGGIVYNIKPTEDGKVYLEDQGYSCTNGYYDFSLESSALDVAKDLYNREIANCVAKEQGRIKIPNWTCYTIGGRMNGKSQLTMKLFENLKASFEIKDVIFNDPATIVFWADGTKTVVKCGKGDKFDKEKGLAMAIVKKIGGNKWSYYNTFKHWIPELKEKEKKTKKGKK